MIFANEETERSLVVVLWMEKGCRYLVRSCYTSNRNASTCQERRRIVDEENSKVEFDIFVTNVFEK